MAVLDLLLDSLAAQRREGASFEAAWPAAVGVALAGGAGLELSEWHSALNGTRSAWEASFNGWGQYRRERALAAVAQDPERVPIGGSGVACPTCGEPVALPARGRRRIYCSHACQRAANGRPLKTAA